MSHLKKIVERFRAEPCALISDTRTAAAALAELDAKGDRLRTAYEVGDAAAFLAAADALVDSFTPTR